jgi:hypothetical protein
VDAAKKIAEAVLYEGYLLWPYRRSSRKNQQRWTFGGVYPREYSVARGEDDPWIMQTQCLMRGDEQTTIEVKVRFLHVVERKVAMKTDEGLQPVEELRVGGDLYLSWYEAAEREIAVGSFELFDLLRSAQKVQVDFAAGDTQESLAEPTGEVVGALVRSWRALRGAVEVGAKLLQEGAFRVTVRITNTTPWGGEDRESTLRQTFVSTHTTLEVEGGEFVSLTDPPEELAGAAEGCENLKTWPVLVGEEGDRSTVLSSPIILYDYPQIAPESPGDLFDGTEIDQMLILNVLNLTDEEKEEMRASDPRGREILERCESLSPEELMRLNGTFRDIRMLRG